MTDSDQNPTSDDDAPDEDAADDDAAADAAAARDNGEFDGPSSADYSVAFSPRQVAVGLAIVAGLVAVVAARRRKRDSPGPD